MAYTETLFGHQDSVTCVDSLDRERAISGGGRDRSVRLWKVVEESQLVFNGHTSTIDCVAMINETNFVSGSEDGSVPILWCGARIHRELIRFSHVRVITAR